MTADLIGDFQRWSTSAARTQSIYHIHPFTQSTIPCDELAMARDQTGNLLSKKSQIVSSFNSNGHILPVTFCPRKAKL